MNTLINRAGGNNFGFVKEVDCPIKINQAIYLARVYLSLGIDCAVLSCWRIRTLLGLYGAQSTEMRWTTDAKAMLTVALMD